MSHEHSVIDQDTQFMVDVSMKITCATEVKALKRGDHAAEKYSFSMPRYIEGHDMSSCNKVEVHYDNMHYDSGTRETTTISSFDEVEDLAQTSLDACAVYFSGFAGRNTNAPNSGPHDHRSCPLLAPGHYRIL